MSTAGNVSAQARPARWQPWFGAFLALAMLPPLVSFVPRLVGALEPAGETSLTAAEERSISSQIEAARLHFVPDGKGSFGVHNAEAGVAATLSADGLLVRDRDARKGVTLRTAAFGRPDALHTLPASTPRATDVTATISRGRIVEWFRNRPGGLEQGWTIPRRPGGRGVVLLDLAVTGGAVSVPGARSAQFRVGSSTIAYDGLTVRDATGKDLPARFVALGEGLRIRVDDRGATYPIVVDPVLSAVDSLGAVENTSWYSFGFDSEMEGRWLVVSALTQRELATAASNGQGAVYAYFDETGNGDWRLVRKLPIPADHAVSAALGGDVDLDVGPDGVTIVAGAGNQNRLLVWSFAGDPLTQAPDASVSGPVVMTGAQPAGGLIGQYGRAVDLEDGTLIIGAPHSTVGGRAQPDGTDPDTNPDGFNERVGLVDVYRQPGGFGTPFQLEQRLHAPAGLTEPAATRDVLQEFGWQVEVEDDLIVVGAPGDDGVQTPTAGTSADPQPPGTSERKGAVHLFRFNAGSWEPTQVVRAETPRSGGELGAAVDLKGGDVLAGEPGRGTAGRVLLFDHYQDATSGADSWTQVAALGADDPTTTLDEAASTAAAFGTSVDFDETGHRLAVGGMHVSVTGAGGVGSAYIFSRPGTTASDAVTFTRRIGGVRGDQAFGSSVGLEGNRLVVGSRQTATLRSIFAGATYTYAASGSDTPISTLRPVGHYFKQGFGYTVVQDRDVLAVAAPLDRRSQTDDRGRGSVAIFRRVAGEWQLEKVIAPDSGASSSTLNTEWGASLALHVRRDADGNETGLWVAVGVPNDGDVDRDGRGDLLAPEPIGAGAGTVGVWGRPGPPGTNWALFGSELWAGGHQGIGAARPEFFDPTTITPGGRFGSSVAFTADGTLVVGEPGADGGAGQVHRFDRSGVNDAFSPSWTFRETVSGSDAATDFGREVDADGKRVLVAGKAGNGFTRLTTFTDGDAATDLEVGAAFQVGLDFPGVSIDAVGDRIAIGSPTARKARVYRLPASADSPLLEGEFAGDPASNFGLSVALDRGGQHRSLVVGAPDADGVGTATVYIARTSTGGQITTWSEAATLAAPDAGPTGTFGVSVQNTPAHGGALVGLPLSDDPQVEAGRVYEFETAGLAPPPGPEVTVDVSAPAEVPVGASYLPTEGLDADVLTENSASPGGIAAAPIGGIDLSQPPEGTNVAASPLSGIPLSGIPLSGIPLSGIPLSGIPLSGIGWESLLEGTEFEGVPLQSIMLQDVYDLPSVQALTLGQIQLEGSPLSGIPLSGIVLGGTPLASLVLDASSTLSALEQWCEALVAAGADTTSLGLDCDAPGGAGNSEATLLGISLQGAPLSGIPLSGIPLSGIPLSGIPLSGIPLSGIDLAGSPLSGIPLSGIPLSGIPLSGIPLSGIPLSGIPLSGIPLSGIQLAGTPLSGIPLSGIDVAGSPLSGIPLSGIPLLGLDVAGSPLSGIPLSGIPLSGIPLSGIPLSGIDLAGTPLSGIPLSGIDVAGSPLSGIPLSGIPLSGIPLSGIPLSGIPLSGIPLSGIDLAGTPLSGIPLSGIDLAGSPLSGIPLSGIPVATRDRVVDCAKADCSTGTLGDALRDAAIKSGATLGLLQGALAGVRLGDLVGLAPGLSVEDLRAILDGKSTADITTWDDVTLGELPSLWQHLTLGQLGAALTGIRLGDIAGLIDGFTTDDVKAALGDLTLDDLTSWDDLTLGELSALWQLLTLGDLTGVLSGVRLGDLAGVIDNGSGGTYTAEQLKQALLAAMGADATLSDLGPDFDDLTLGELAEYGDTTIGQLLGALSDAILDGITLGDLLLALIARSQYPWEELDLDQVLAQPLADSPASVPVEVAFEAQAPDGQARDVQVTVRPPYGSVFRAGSATLSLPMDGEQLDPVQLDGALRWTFPKVPAGAVHTLSFRLEPTTRLGTSDIKATATLPADDEWAFDTTGVTVTEVLEPNDVPADASALPSDTLTLSHVSTSGDRDLFRFDVAEAGTRVTLNLSNLDADLDLTLYGPRASSSAIQDTSDRSITPVEDEGASVVPPDEGVAPLADDDVPADLTDLAVHGRSIRRGDAHEQVDATLVPTGTYYVAVTGYNGATNRDPYALRLKKLGLAAPACPARSVSEGQVGGALPAQLPAGTNTVFLLNSARLSGLHGASAAAEIGTAVAELVSYVNDPAQAPLGVKAAVLHVDADAGVRAAYDAWDASPCVPDRANGVAAEIVRVLDTYRDAGVRPEHIVVVGGDDAIPFARVPDKTAIANERGYASTFAEARHALQAGLAHGFVQTDDAYGDVDPYGFADRVLYVTDAAVGRLVETPAEIVDQLGDFVSSGGKLDVGTGLVTGYDFLTDGANATADGLESTYSPVDRTLVSDTWSRQDLEDAISTLTPDLTSLNAHFDHYRALPGQGNSTGDESDLFTAAAVRGALDGDLAGSVVFSMGCHSGLSASDLLAAPGRDLDFAQAIASQGGVFVGNTGYGYGDTEAVALSEQLMAGYARRLDGAMSVGEALQYAKAEYAADLTVYGVYDEKALMEATLYGLPFYRLAVENPPPLPPLPPAPVLSPDPIAGIDTSTLAVFPDFQEKTTDDGDTYWVGTGADGEEQVTAVHDRPLQPRSEESFTAPPGTEAHDALVLELDTTDRHGVSPHIVQPIVDDGDERVDGPVDVAFPTGPVRVNPELTPRGEAFTMSATTGYFRTTAADGTGIQRLVDEMVVTPYFVDEDVADFVRPTFSRVDTVVVDGTLSFAVDVSDDRGGPERVKRVYVLVLSDPRHGIGEQWLSVDLVRGEGTRWTGSLPIGPGRFEFIVQAVDAAGNVAITTNKGVNFREQATGQDGTASTLDVELTGSRGDAGWWRSAVEVTATGGSGLTYEVVGEVDERLYDGPFTISGDGPHFVIVRSSDGQAVARTVRIDTVGPRVVITQPQDGAVVAHNSGTTAQFACLDAGSGVTGCDATLTVRQGFGGGSGTTSAVQNGDDVSGTIGRHTLQVTTGPDVAGNLSDPGTATSNFSVAPPPRIEAVNLPGNPGGKTKSMSTSYRAPSDAGPFTTTYAWDDGTSTVCRSDQDTAACATTVVGDYVTTTATHTYPNLDERTVTSTVMDRAGQTGVGELTFNKTSAISAIPARISLWGFSIKLGPGAISAYLDDGKGAPLVGRAVDFETVLGIDLCSTVTDSSGVAKCGALTLPLSALAGAYRASFAGDSTHLAVSGTAGLG